MQLRKIIPLWIYLLFLLVPILNILTPLFAAIFMVHYVKALMRREAGALR